MRASQNSTCCAVKRASVQYLAPSSPKEESGECNMEVNLGHGILTALYFIRI